MTTDPPAAVDKLIAGSGNAFHARVARRLQNLGWSVQISPYYLDQSQGKPREIDLVAERLFPLRDSFDRATGYVCLRLFVECKYITAPSVFWMADLDEEAAMASICARSPFKPGNSYTERHHYLEKPKQVAKLFASSTERSQENDPIYKGLSQSLSALVSMRGRRVAVKPRESEHATPKHIIDLPVIACSSFESFYAVPFFDDRSPKRIKRNFRLEVNYAYMSSTDRIKDEYFLIDIVELEQLDAFSEAVCATGKAAAYLAHS